MLLAMPNASRLVRQNKPGPVPVFTERVEVRLRPDQVKRLDRIAKAFRMTQSDLIRLALDQFGEAVEEGPFLAHLEEVEVGP